MAQACVGLTLGHAPSYGEPGRSFSIVFEMSRGDTLILCYHGVSEDWPTDYVVTPGDLERQMVVALHERQGPSTIRDDRQVDELRQA